MKQAGALLRAEGIGFELHVTKIDLPCGDQYVPDADIYLDYAQEQHS